MPTPMDQQPTTGPGPTTLQPGPQLIPNWVSGGVYTPYTQPPRQILVKAPDTFERQLNVSALNEPCRVTFGRDRIGAQILHALNYNGKLLVVCHYGRGVVQEIESFTVSDVTAASVTATHYLGTTSQTVDAKLVTAFAALGITHSTAMTGHVYGVYEFPVGSSIGDIHIVLKGLKLYDSRDGAQSWASPSTYVYTDNPAVCLANAIANTTWGLGASFDWAGSEDAFDACDDMTSGEKKRLIGLTLDRRLSAHEWCEILRAHAGCFIVRSNGQYKLVPDAPASSVRTFSKANKDIIKGSLRWQRTGLDQQPNVVEFTYTDTSVIPWKTATAIYPANGIPPGSEELRLARIDLPGCQRYSQAMREVHERRNHARIEGLLFTFDTFADAIAQEPGDVCTLDDDNMFAGIDFRLLDKSMKRKGRFTITGKKYDVASYNNSAEADPTYEDTTLPTPQNPPTVENLVLTETVVTVPTGALPLSKINGTWDSLATTYPFLAGYRVIVTDAADTVVDMQDVSTNIYVSPPLNAFSTYTVKVYARSSIAVSATALTGTITLVSTGVGSLATIYSQSIPVSGWSFFSNDGYPFPYIYTNWQGDPYLRIRADMNQVETTVYPGANMSSPGRDTQLLDGCIFTEFDSNGSSVASSPFIDFLTNRYALYAVLNVAHWMNLYSQTLNIIVILYDDSFVEVIRSEEGRAIGQARYAKIIVINRHPPGPSGLEYFSSSWQIEFDTATIASLMPTVIDSIPATSSASAGVVVQLPRKYITITNVQITSESTTQANPSYSNLTVSETVLEDNKLTLHCYDSANARVAVPCSIQVTGVEAV